MNREKNGFIPLFRAVLSFAGNTSENVTPPPLSCRPPPPLHASFTFGVIDRCCCLFIWSGFNNMKLIARSCACCCLYGPLSVSCPLNEKWKRERRQMNQRCVIYYEKRLNGNRATSEINTEQSACRMEREYQTRSFTSLLFPLSFCFLPLFLAKVLIPAYSFKNIIDLFWYLKKKGKRKKTSNMKVTLLALVYMPCHFSPTPQKQWGGIQ